MAKKVLIKFKPEVINDDIPEEAKKDLEEMFPQTIVALDQGDKAVDVEHIQTIDPVQEQTEIEPVEQPSKLLNSTKDNSFVINGPEVEKRSGFLSHETNDPILSRVQAKMENEYGQALNYLENNCFTRIPELLIDPKEVDIIEPDKIPPSMFYGSTVMHSRHSTYNAVYSSPELCAKDAEAYKTLIMHNFNFTARGLLRDMVDTICVAYNGIIKKHIGDKEKEAFKNSERCCIFDGPSTSPFIYPFSNSIPQINYLSKLTSFVYDAETRSIGISQNTLNTYVSVIANYCENVFLEQLNGLMREAFSDNDALRNDFFVRVVADVSWFRAEFERFIMATLVELITIAKMHIEAIESHLHEPAPQKSQLKDPPYKINPFF